jgi:hypothetical protein
MTQRTNAEPEDLSKDKSAIRRPRRLDSVQAADSLAQSIGTPEHAALVEVVKRNFPEIYEDVKGKKGTRAQSV